MSLLLAQVISYFIPTFIALFLIATAVAILILCAENDVESDKYRKARRKCLEEEKENENIEKVATYHKSSYYCANEKCSSDTYKFINILNELFPEDFTIIPNVSIGRLIEAFDNPNKKYNPDTLNDTIDVGIFYKCEMQPLVMIDLVNEDINKNYKTITKDVAVALNNLKLPIAEIVVANNYDLEFLKQEILKLMPQKIRKKYL